MKRLPVRRAGVLSLFVALFALAGASVPPTRGLTGTDVAAIVWEARSSRQAPVLRHARHRVPIRTASATPPSAIAPARVSSSLVRHALFQRPPPVAL